MTVIFFDLDDTLYDQLLPFKRACGDHFPHLTLDIQALFKRSRELSDHVFERSENGQMSSDQMKIYRIQEALRSFGQTINSDQALAFQKTYETYQQQIFLSWQMTELLTLCKEKGVSLGLISNGPWKHQASKIKRLGLEKWIPSQHIWISGKVKLAKPDPRIFDLAKSGFGTREDRFYFVGDNFTNDIIGAMRAGWIPIWFNKRQHKIDSYRVKGVCQVSTEEELFHLLKKILDS